MNAWGQKLGAWFTNTGSRAKGLGRGLTPPGQKSSAVSGLLGAGSKAAFISFASPRWTGRTYEALSREGFRKNVVVNRCVRILSEGAASVPLQLFRGDKPLDKHPLLDLLKNPNPLQSGTEMMAGFYAYLEIAGNAYLELVLAADGRPGELYVLRPERMKIVPGPNGWPMRFEYKVGAKSHNFVVDNKTGLSPIMHLKTFNPEDDHYGLSALEPSAFAVGIHNSAADWNKALLDNAARPSGALLFEPSDGTPANLSDEQFKRLKAELEDNYQGAINAGRPFLLEGGLKWHAWVPANDEIDIPTTDVALGQNRIADQRSLPPVNVGGAIVSVSENPLSAVDAGSTARIDIAQHDKHYGFGTVTYNSGSISSLGFDTQYFVYVDDPNLGGGSVTYLATTTITNVTDSNSRIYVGEITTPADGGSSSTGSGGGGISGDILV